MKIDFYSFGHIVIDGRPYTSDVIIYHDRVDASWWRKEGHRLDTADLAEVVKSKPDILIIGTGYSGVMRVPKETTEYIVSHGIDLRVERTGKAVDLFNALQGRKERIIAALHITC